MTRNLFLNVAAKWTVNLVHWSLYLGIYSAYFSRRASLRLASYFFFFPGEAISYIDEISPYDLIDFRDRFSLAGEVASLGVSSDDKGTILSYLVYLRYFYYYASSATLKNTSSKVVMLIPYYRIFS